MTLTKYCTWHDDDTYGNTDDKNELEYDDDATITNWGDNWRTPLKPEIDELIDGCYWKWTNNFNGSGVSGTIGTSKSNGKCIFFPESGYYTEKGKIVLYYVGDMEAGELTKTLREKLPRYMI